MNAVLGVGASCPERAAFVPERTLGLPYERDYLDDESMSGQPSDFSADCCPRFLYSLDWDLSTLHPPLGDCKLFLVHHLLLLFSANLTNNVNHWMPHVIYVMNSSQFLLVSHCIILSGFTGRFNMVLTLATASWMPNFVHVNAVDTRKSRVIMSHDKIDSVRLKWTYEGMLHSQLSLKSWLISWDADVFGLCIQSRDDLSWSALKCPSHLRAWDQMQVFIVSLSLNVLCKMGDTRFGTSAKLQFKTHSITCAANHVNFPSFQLVCTQSASVRSGRIANWTVTTMVVKNPVADWRLFEEISGPAPTYVARVARVNATCTDGTVISTQLALPYLNNSTGAYDRLSLCSLDGSNPSQNVHQPDTEGVFPFEWVLWVLLCSSERCAWARPCCV